mgnify:CR=1 FL=1
MIGPITKTEDDVRRELKYAVSLFRKSYDNSPDIFNPEQGLAIAYAPEHIDRLVWTLFEELQQLRNEKEHD